MRSAGWKAAAPIVLGLALALSPAPSGLAPRAWSYFALFAAVILGLILEPLPGAAVALVGVTIAGVGHLVEPNPAASVAWALSGFQDRTVWLIVGSFVLAIGYGKSSLSRRIAL